MLPAFAVVPEIVSQIWIPEMLAADVTGPNVTAAVFVALPPGEAAAPNVIVWRVTPDPVHSLPLVEVGDPSDNPTALVVGWVGLAPPRTQSNIAFSA